MTKESYNFGVDTEAKRLYTETSGMTAKRFEINNDMNLDDKVETYEFSCIVDNSNKTFYFVVDSIANVESFVERLNELHEENKELRMVIDGLKQQNQKLKGRLNDLGVEYYD